MSQCHLHHLQDTYIEYTCLKQYYCWLHKRKSKCVFSQTLIKLTALLLHQMYFFFLTHKSQCFEDSMHFRCSIWVSKVCVCIFLFTGFFLCVVESSSSRRVFNDTYPSNCYGFPTAGMRLYIVISCLVVHWDTHSHNPHPSQLSSLMTSPTGWWHVCGY